MGRKAGRTKRGRPPLGGIQRSRWNKPKWRYSSAVAKKVDRLVAKCRDGGDEDRTESYQELRALARRLVKPSVLTPEQLDALRKLLLPTPKPTHLIVRLHALWNRVSDHAARHYMGWSSVRGPGSGRVIRQAIWF
jgi:hypothetical protein